MLFSMKSDALTLLGTPPLSTAATHRQFALIKINVIISTKLDKYLLNGVRVCVSLCVCVCVCVRESLNVGVECRVEWKPALT